MTDMEPENPGPLLKYMRSRNADRIAQLTAERDRLREALSMIAVMGFSSSHEVSSNIGRMAVEQARAALKGETP